MGWRIGRVGLYRGLIGLTLIIVIGVVLSWLWNVLVYIALPIVLLCGGGLVLLSRRRRR